jgi:hypothetical protein
MNPAPPVTSDVVMSLVSPFWKNRRFCRDQPIPGI